MTDPLNFSVPLAGVNTQLPLLPEADYLFQVKESTIVPNKDQNGYNWKLKLGLASPTTAIDGRDIQPDFPVFDIAALQAKPDSTDPEAFKRGLGERVDAIFGTTMEDRPEFTKALVDSAVGKMVVAHVVIDNYQGKDSNKVKRLKKANV